MSMFYELMMRKKEETLYPVIKGSLTENPSGVFSGFVDTGDNYLKLDNASIISSADTWEICLYLINSAKEYIIGTDKQRIITVSRQTGKIYLSSDGLNWDIASGIGSGSLPSTCYARIRFTGTKYIFDYSTDKVNWTVCAEVNSSTKIYAPSYLKIGAWWSSQTSNFTGSIDLNNSYIKLGSTKYNLQAVVGYTIVGSPTIVDGVVSGFSSANYLKTANTFPSDINNFEINLKIKATSFSANYQNILFFSGTQRLSLEFYYGIGYRMYYYNTSSSSNTAINKTGMTFNSDTWYDFKISYNLSSQKITVNRGLGIGDWAQSPIPNPQSPIPNPHIFYFNQINSYLSTLNII